MIAARTWNALALGGLVAFVASCGGAMIDSELAGEHNASSRARLQRRSTGKQPYEELHPDVWPAL